MIYMKIGWLLLPSYYLFLHFPQNKLLTIEEAMLNARTTLAPDNMRQIIVYQGGL